ncbi:hypothetical protein SUGI_1053620 [Cryptomeria japonica]|nr:hypothetical protein SUGI_1053620 [Cryptomeria japonica]
MILDAIIYFWSLKNDRKWFLGNPLNYFGPRCILAVTNCDLDMESLVLDQNHSIATMAIPTLPKIGNESCMDHLMKQIINLMSGNHWFPRAVERLEMVNINN